MSDLITPAGKHLLVAPSWKPVHRNSHVISYGPSFAPRRADGYASIGQGEGEGLLEAGRSLTWSARTAHAQWNQRRWGRGFPLWAKRSDVLDAESGTAAPSPDLEGEAALDVKDEPGLKAWCEAFCADRGWLKTFQLRREPWGWNFDGLCKAAKGVIHSTGYQSPDLMVYVEIDEDKMVVRPDNWWSRAINRVSLETDDEPRSHRSRSSFSSSASRSSIPWCAYSTASTSPDSRAGSTTSLERPTISSRSLRSHRHIPEKPSHRLKTASRACSRSTRRSRGIHCSSSARKACTT